MHIMLDIYHIPNNIFIYIQNISYILNYVHIRY